MLFLQYPWKFHVINPLILSPVRCLVFFWKQFIMHQVVRQVLGSHLEQVTAVVNFTYLQFQITNPNKKILNKNVNKKQKKQKQKIKKKDKKRFTKTKLTLFCQLRDSMSPDLQMSFFQTAAVNLRCCQTVRQLQPCKTSQHGNGKALESSTFEIRKSMMVPK